ncbi:MAG: 23S rRNA (adenine(2503)-C(2))-methyltransferase RlmN [candidate division Zixibacteria bacterium]
MECIIIIKIKMVEKNARIVNLRFMEKADLKEMNRKELVKFVGENGLEPFRANQIFKWIFQENASDFSSMTDISKKHRSFLDGIAEIKSAYLKTRKESSDGTIKFLFRLDDGYLIESVLIPEKRRLTLCVSSQAGCALGCRFCATGAMGFMRNLSSGEIVDQFLQAQESSSGRISNIVFMGMGEPTLNLKSVLKACDIISDNYGPSLSKRRITVSTAGVVHALKRFVTKAGKLGLAISLHSADQGVRMKIMPSAEKNDLVEIMKEAKRYTELSGRRVSFEYLLLGGVNDSIADAKKLVKLIHGIPCKINLIRYNPNDGLPFRRPLENDVQKFREFLYPRTYAVMIRESRGLDIKGACGQLATAETD